SARGRRPAPRSRAATTARGPLRGISSARSSRRAGCRACAGPPGASRRGTSAAASGPHPSIGPATLSAVATRTATAETDWGRSAPGKTRRNAPPVLVRQVRNGVEESAHRGDIVEVDIGGRMHRALGDPAHPVNLRSAAKPFALLALIEAGGVREFELETPELALMTGSHSGEDLHVRTLQAL